MFGNTTSLYAVSPLHLARCFVTLLLGINKKCEQQEIGACVCHRENFPSDRRLGWGVDVSARVLRPAQALVEKRPYIYMGGYDPKVIKNREKLHFFFRLPLFLLSILDNSALFPCNLRTASLPTCRHFPPFFRSKPPWYAHKNPLRKRCRGDYSSCFEADHLKDAHRHRSKRGEIRSKRGGIRSKRGSTSTLLIAKFRALLYRQPASVPTVPHRAQ